MRRPPNLRRPDHCGKCRAYINLQCDLYNYVILEPENWVCDDFREDE